MDLVLTNGGHFDTACAMDFEGFKFYDTWVTRDVQGDVMSSWYAAACRT